MIIVTSTTRTPFLKEHFKQYQLISKSIINLLYLLIFTICYTSKNIKRLHGRTHESTLRSTPNFLQGAMMGRQFTDDYIQSLNQDLLAMKNSEMEVLVFESPKG
jgi:transcriptional regulator of heat shock response